MKTNLTLKSSSMLFFGKVNLLRNVPVEVETDALTLTSIKMINKFIKSGAIISTEGLIEVPESLTDKLETPVEVKLDTEVVTKEEAPLQPQEVSADLPKEDVVVKEAKPVEVKEEKVEKKEEKPIETPKKTATKKATTKKATTETKPE